MQRWHIQEGSDTGIGVSGRQGRQGLELGALVPDKDSISATLLPGWVNSGRLLNLSEPQIKPLQSEDALTLQGYCGK